MWLHHPGGPCCYAELLVVTLWRFEHLRVGGLRATSGSSVEVGMVCEWRRGDFYKSQGERADQSPCWGRAWDAKGESEFMRTQVGVCLWKAFPAAFLQCLSLWGAFVSLLWLCCVRAWAHLRVSWALLRSTPQLFSQPSEPELSVERGGRRRGEREGRAWHDPHVAMILLVVIHLKNQRGCAERLFLVALVKELLTFHSTACFMASFSSRFQTFCCMDFFLPNVIGSIHSSGVDSWPWPVCFTDYLMKFV